MVSMAHPRTDRVALSQVSISSNGVRLKWDPKLSWFEKLRLCIPPLFIGQPTAAGRPLLDPESKRKQSIPATLLLFQKAGLALETSLGELGYKSEFFLVRRGVGLQEAAADSLVQRRVGRGVAFWVASGRGSLRGIEVHGGF